MISACDAGACQAPTLYFQKKSKVHNFYPYMLWLLNWPTLTVYSADKVHRLYYMHIKCREREGLGGLINSNCCPNISELTI